MSENQSDQNEIDEDFKSNDEQDDKIQKTQAYQQFFESRDINISSQSKLRQSVQRVIQLFKNDQKSQNITIYDILCAYYNIVQNNNDPRTMLHDLFVLRVISNDWINIRNTKYYNIVLLILDFQLNNLCKHLLSFSCNKIAGALLFIQQVEIFAESKFIPGRIRFYNEYINYLTGHKDKINQFDEDTIYLLDDAKTIQNYDIFLSHLLQSLRQFIQNNQRNANIDLVMEPLQKNLKRCQQELFENIPEKTKDLLKEIIDLVDNTICLAQYKETVYVIPDLPIIKIKPLTPRIKDEFLLDNSRTVKKSDKDDLKKLKKKQKIMKKQLTRELVSDQQEINRMKKNDKQRQLQSNAKAYKGFKHQMDEAQLELKKLKTQQIHHKRIKKQSRRVGGNKFKK